MKAMQLVKILQKIVIEHGDLPICGGYMNDDSGLREVSLVDKNGLDAAEKKTKPVSIFLEQ